MVVDTGATVLRLAGTYYCETEMFLTNIKLPLNGTLSGLAKVLYNHKNWAHSE